MNLSVKKKNVFLQGWCLYIILCQEIRHLYVGISRNPTRRFEQHKTGNGAAFVKKYGFRKGTVIQRNISTQKEALRLENELTLKLRGYPYVVSGGKFAQRTYRGA